MKKILVASYSCKLWPISRQDRRINAAIGSRIGLSSKAFNGRKFRINPKRPEWLDICRNRDAFRTFHYAVTVPYKHGVSLLNPLALDEYQERFEFHKAEHDRLVGVLFENIEDIKAEARTALTTEDGNCFYREADYADLTRDAFSFEGLIEPLVHDATFDKFADIIGDERAQELAEKLQAENDRAFKASCASVADKLVGVLKHASDKLHNGQRLHDSVMDNLQELTDMLPVLNLGNDEKIETARRELAALFRQYSAQSVKDKLNRSNCAAEVDRILAKF